MPTYSNTGTDIVTITQPRVLIIPPGETVETNFYLKSLPTGVTFDSDEPTISPWTILYQDTDYPSDDIDVTNVNEISIYNVDSAITISANGDDENAFNISPKMMVTLNNKNGMIGKLTILTGSGTTYVYSSSIKITAGYIDTPYSPPQ
jgi:hypothetical protein